jgi:hypothetical protein
LEPDVLGLELKAGLRRLSDEGYEFVTIQMTAKTAGGGTARIVRQRTIGEGRIEILYANF